MDILDDMGVSKLSAKVFFKVNYSFKKTIQKIPAKLLRFLKLFFLVIFKIRKPCVTESLG